MTMKKMDKHCNGCDTWKMYEEFYKNASKSDGRDSRCIECRKAYKRSDRGQNQRKKDQQARKDRDPTIQQGIDERAAKREASALLNRLKDYRHRYRDQRKYKNATAILCTTCFSLLPIMGNAVATCTSGPCTASRASAARARSRVLYELNKDRTCVVPEFSTCTNCLEEKPASKFKPRKESPSGLTSRCRECINNSVEYKYKEATTRERGKDYPGYVYLLTDNPGCYKIGKTINPPEDRIYTLQGGNSTEITLVHSVWVMDCYFEEARLHREYQDHNIRREWFKLTDTQVSDIITDLDRLSL